MSQKGAKHQDSSKKQNITKNRFLLLTKMIDARKLLAEIEKLQNDMFTELMKEAEE